MKDELEYKLKVSKLDQAIVQKAMDRELKDAGVKIKDKELEGVLNKSKN